MRRMSALTLVGFLTVLVMGVVGAQHVATATVSAPAGRLIPMSDLSIMLVRDSGSSNAIVVKELDGPGTQVCVRGTGTDRYVAGLITTANTSYRTLAIRAYYNGSGTATVNITVRDAGDSVRTTHSFALTPGTQFHQFSYEENNDWRTITNFTGWKVELGCVSTYGDAVVVDEVGVNFHN